MLRVDSHLRRGGRGLPFGSGSHLAIKTDQRALATSAKPTTTLTHQGDHPSHTLVLRIDPGGLTDSLRAKLHNHDSTVPFSGMKQI